MSYPTWLGNNDKARFGSIHSNKNNNNWCVSRCCSSRGQRRALGKQQYIKHVCLLPSKRNTCDTFVARNSTAALDLNTFRVVTRHYPNIHCPIYPYVYIYIFVIHATARRLTGLRSFYPYRTNVFSELYGYLFTKQTYPVFAKPSNRHWVSAMLFVVRALLPRRTVRLPIERHFETLRTKLVDILVTTNRNNYYTRGVRIGYSSFKNPGK